MLGVFMNINSLYNALSDKFPVPALADEDDETVYDAEGNSYYFPAVTDNTVPVTSQMRSRILHAHLLVQN